MNCTTVYASNNIKKKDLETFELQRNALFILVYLLMATEYLIIVIIAFDFLQGICSTQLYAKFMNKPAIV